jgi:NADH:ubiquinone oxidoreductase subunit F (NADH-binding)
MPSTGETVNVGVNVARRYRLLGHPSDLAGHLDEFGPLPLPARGLKAWRASFTGVMEASGLTGRGGAAFPAAIKLATASSARGHGIVVVNGMEGEPASRKDWVLLTQAPHLVLDGAQLIAAACGADQVVVCVPEHRDAVAAAVGRAVTERAAADYAPVREVIVRPPDRFVAGEESALARWMTDRRALPAFRPDKRIPLRLGNRPLLVHNAETLGHVALIARHGADAFRERGIAEEPGTTLVTISGAVTLPGLVEVDRGTPLCDILALAAPVDPVAALLVGGYAGAWVSPRHFGTPYASIPLRTIGATAGVGVVIALGATTCGVAATAGIAAYMAGQSSGQCGPCVFGLPAVADDLTRLADGRPDPDLLSRLRRRLDQVDGRGGCRHPDGVVGMVRSALTVFAADVEAHQGGLPCTASP